MATLTISADTAPQASILARVATFFADFGNSFAKARLAAELYNESCPNGVADEKTKQAIIDLLR